MCTLYCTSSFMSACCSFVVWLSRLMTGKWGVRNYNSPCYNSFMGAGKGKSKRVKTATTEKRSTNSAVVLGSAGTYGKFLSPLLNERNLELGRDMRLEELTDRVIEGLKPI